MKKLCVFFIFLCSCSIIPTKNWYDIDISKINCNKSDLNDIVKWVENNISYKYDIYTDIPENTLNKKYGDCKDIAVLASAIFFQTTGEKADIAVGYFNGNRKSTHAEVYYLGKYFNLFCSFEKLYVVKFDDIKYFIDY